MCVLIFSATFVRNISRLKKNSARYYHKCTSVFMYSARYSLCTVHLTLYVQCTLLFMYSARYSLCTVHVTLYVQCTLLFMYSTRYSCQLSMKLECSPQIFKKYSNNKFYDNPCSMSRVAPYGQTEVRTDRYERRY
jgi:hypothetical protein